MEQSRQPPIVGLDVSKAWLDGYLAPSGRRLRVGNDRPGRGGSRPGARRPCRLPGGDGGVGRLRAHRPSRARGPGCAGRDRQSEAGARLRPRHRPGGQDRPGRRQADRPLRRDHAPGRDTRARPGTPGAARDPGLPAPADRGDHRAAPAARAAAQPGGPGQGRADPARPAPGGQGARPAPARDDPGAAGPGRRRRPAHQHARLRTRSWPPPCWPSCRSSARLDRRKVAALAGLAPVARDSGLREHRRVIKGGRGQVRRALYMAAVASLKTDKSPLKARYARLARPRQAAQARAHRTDAHHARHPQRHAQGQIRTGKTPGKS